MLKHYYKEAHLVESKSGYGLYVVWWCYCALTEKVKRFRKKVTSKKQGELLCNDINTKLKNGAIMHREEREKRDLVEKGREKTVGEVLTFFMENKAILRKDSVRSYKSHNSMFMEWCKENDLENAPISKLTKSHILAYLDWCMIEKGNIARTRNSKLETLLTIFNFLVEREVMPKNVCNGIKKLREQQSRTQAIAPVLVPVIRSLIKERSVPLYIFTSFVYYCFIRPKELLLLDWGNIDMKGGKIFLPSTISKNGKSEHIILPAAMREILNEYYSDGVPQNGKVIDSRYTTLFKQQKKILRKEGLPIYGLYEWKHTGVTAYFKAGVNIKYIQQQCRHSSLDYTDKYLKGLGLIDNTDAFDNIPRI